MPLPAGTVDIWDGLRARTQDDSALIALTGAQSTGTARIAEGWWDDTEDEADYPRVACFIPSELPNRAITEGRIQVDIWAWPDGANGGRGRLLRIDGRLLELLDEKWWTHNGVRYYAVALAARDYPTAPGSPLRRKRDYLITAHSLN